MKYLFSFDKLFETLEKSHRFESLLNKMKYWYNDKVANILLGTLVKDYNDSDDINRIDYENNELTFLPKKRRAITGDSSATSSGKSQAIKAGKLAKHILDNIVPKLETKKTLGAIHKIPEGHYDLKYGTHILIVPKDILDSDKREKWDNYFGRYEVYPMTMKVRLQEKYLLKKNKEFEFTGTIKRVISDFYLKKKYMNSEKIECLAIYFETEQDLPVSKSSVDTVRGGRNLYVDFNNIELKLLLYTDNDIEKFSTRLKALEESKFEVKEVSGEKIRFYYDQTNSLKTDGIYYNVRSCMSTTDKQEYLDIYVENPEKIKLLVLLDERGLLLARALLWKLDYSSDPDGKYLVDRVYFSHPSQEDFFRKYAQEKNYLYIINKNTIMKGNRRINVKLEVNLKKWDFAKYPFLDNMYIFNKKNGKLMNYERWREIGIDELDNKDFVKLQNTNGRYSSIY